MSEKKVEFANTLRGFAALCVLVEHYLGTFWTLRPTMANLTHLPELPAKYGAPFYVHWVGFASWWSLGLFGVGVFFLISGFVIPFSLAKSTRLGFTLNRLLRIYPTYAAGVAVGILAIYVGSLIYQAPWQIPLYTLPFALPGLHELFNSPTYDGVIWTLDIELKFYLVCLLFLPLLNKRPRLALLIPLAFAPISVVCALAPIDSSISYWTGLASMASRYIALMFVGVALSFRFRNLISSLECAAFGALNYLVFLGLWIVESPGDLILAVSFSIAVVLFVACYLLRDRIHTLPITAFLANISYPLYICHGVFGVVFIHVLLDLGLRPSVSILIVATAALAIAWLIHLTVERPSQRFYRSLRQATLPDELENTVGSQTNG